MFETTSQYPLSSPCCARTLARHLGPESRRPETPGDTPDAPWLPAAVAAATAAAPRCHRSRRGGAGRGDDTRGGPCCEHGG